MVSPRIYAGGLAPLCPESLPANHIFCYEPVSESNTDCYGKILIRNSIQQTCCSAHAFEFNLLQANRSMKRKPKLGIIIAKDLSKGLPFGGDLGFLQNILPELHLDFTVFGAAMETQTMGAQADLLPEVQFVPTFGAKYPSAVPLRLKSLVGYGRNRKRILGSDADLLYVHSPEAILPFLFGRRHLPVVFHQHGATNPMVCSRFRWGRAFIFRWFYDIVLMVVHRRADWIIAVDRLCMEQARKHGAEAKTTLLPNAVDIREFCPDAELRRSKRKDLGFRDSEVVALFAGRLEEGKRVEHAIHAASLLSTTEYRFRLVVAGDGSCRQSLEQLACRLGLEGQVTFQGYTPHAVLPALYNAADVLLLPSDWEGTSMVILEALACGTPVVARAIGGTPDVVHTGQNGVLYENPGEANLALAIQESLSRKWSRPQIAASVAKWSSANVARRLEKIFGAVFAHHN